MFVRFYRPSSILEIMTLSKTTVVAALAVLVLLTATTGTWIHHLSSPFGRSVLLPDGSQLELQRSDFGSTHLFTASDSWWRHRLDEWVPKRFRPAGGFVRNRARMQMGGEDETLALAGRRTTPTGAEPWGLRLAVVNRLGEEFFDSNSGILTSGELRMEAFVLLGIPRREKEVQLQFFIQPPTGPEVRALNFRLPNPVYRSYPQWTPEPLPARRTAGSLEVVLDRLLGESTLPNHGLNPSGTLHREAVARVQLQEGGVSTTRWFPTDVVVSDATGNQFSTGLPDVQTNGNSILVPLRGALWPGEAAWKLRLKLAKASGFGDEEILRCKTVEIPRSDEVVSVSEMLRNADGTVEVDSLCGVRSKRSGNWRYPTVEGSCVLCIDWQPTGPDRWMELVEVIDDRGRAVAFQASNRSARYQCHGISPLPDAKALNFKFASQQVQTVEFLAAAESAPKP